MLRIIGWGETKGSHDIMLEGTAAMGMVEISGHQYTGVMEGRDGLDGVLESRIVRWGIGMDVHIDDDNIRDLGCHQLKRGTDDLMDWLDDGSRDSGSRATGCKGRMG
jgi:hypothetical protein